MDIFDFGKWKYHHPSEVPIDYLQWALRTVPNLDPSLRDAIHASLNKRGARAQGEQSRSSSSYTPPPSRLPVCVSADVAAEIVREGRRALAMRYHPDRAEGDAEIMVQVNATSDFLEKRLPEMLKGGRI